MSQTRAIQKHGTRPHDTVTTGTPDKELDALPRFLPNDIKHGCPALELRCHQALAQAGWNAHPDWRPHLQRAGFQLAGQRAATASSATNDGTALAPTSTGRYAHAYLSRIYPLPPRRSAAS